MYSKLERLKEELKDIKRKEEIEEELKRRRQER
jgi:hypothetical protein